MMKNPMSRVAPVAPTVPIITAVTVVVKEWISGKKWDIISEKRFETILPVGEVLRAWADCDGDERKMDLTDYTEVWGWSNFYGPSVSITREVCTGRPQCIISSVSNGWKE